MGSYLNPGNFAFRKSLNSKIYVDGVAEAVTQSKKLLESLWELDGSAVADGIDRAHREISILQYNDENSLDEDRRR